MSKLPSCNRACASNNCCAICSCGMPRISSMDLYPECKNVCQSLPTKGQKLRKTFLNLQHNHRRPLIRSVGVDSILARLACKMLYTHRNKCYSYLNHCLDHLSGLQVLRGAVRVRTCVAELHQQPPWQGAVHRDSWCVSSRVSRVKLNPTQTVRVFYFGPRFGNRFLASLAN